MAMHWTDTRDIAIALAEAHPDVDPRYVRFTDLHRWVCALPGFAGACRPRACRLGLVFDPGLVWSWVRWRW